MSITRSHIDHTLAMFCPSHDQDVTPKGNAPWHVNRHGEVDVEVRVRLEEDLELVMVGTFHNGCIAVVDVWLNVVLVEVVLRHGIPISAIIMCWEMDLTGRDVLGRI